MEEGLKVIELKAKNIKRIKAIDITPQDSTVIISGRNEQGKTSVLDSIWMALGGAAAAKDTPVPIREGESEAEAIVDLGKYKVTRTWTAKGSYLKVESPDGARYPSPQALLDDLRGDYTFDLLDFAKAKPADQKKILMFLTGLEDTLSHLEQLKSKIYADRTMVNRELKNARVKLDGLPVPPEDTPETLIDISHILNEQADAQREHADLDGRRNMLVGARQQEASLTERLKALEESSGGIHQSFNDLCESIEARYLDAIRLAEQERTEKRVQADANKSKSLAQLGQDIEAIKKGLAETIAVADDMAVKIDSFLPLPPVESYRVKIAEAEEINNQVRQLLARQEQELAVLTKESEAFSLTSQLDELEQQKDEAISKASFPIADLGFDDNGVTYKGIPFVQCSSAERLRVSLAIAMALNPKIKVLRITDGSLLDSANLKVISEMVESKGYQLWIEKVSDNGGVGIVIEDGEVKGAEGA